MPYTLAHPAAVLPFKKLPPRWISFSALVIGSMITDLSYAYPHNNFDYRAHTFEGSYKYCFPVGVVALIFFYLFRKPVVRLLPQHQRLVLLPLCEQPVKAPLIILLSLMVGIWTHQMWDSATHTTGWLVIRVRWLQQIVFQYHGRLFLMCHLMLYISSIGGVILLVYVYEKWKWQKSMLAGAPPKPPSLAFALLMGFLVFPIELYHHAVHGSHALVVTGAFSLLLVIGVILKK